MVNAKQNDLLNTHRPLPLLPHTTTTTNINIINNNNDDDDNHWFPGTEVAPLPSSQRHRELQTSTSAVWATTRCLRQRLP